MKILITGGAGYIGSILANDLLNSGNQVTIVDTFSYNENSLSYICTNEKLKIIKCDFRDISSYREDLN